MKIIIYRIENWEVVYYIFVDADIKYVIISDHIDTLKSIKLSVICFKDEYIKKNDEYIKENSEKKLIMSEKLIKKLLSNEKELILNKNNKNYNNKIINILLKNKISAIYNFSLYEWNDMLKNLKNYSMNNKVSIKITHPLSKEGVNKICGNQ